MWERRRVNPTAESSENPPPFSLKSSRRKILNSLREHFSKMCKLISSEKHFSLFIFIEIFLNVLLLLSAEVCSLSRSREFSTWKWDEKISENINRWSCEIFHQYCKIIKSENTSRIIFRYFFSLSLSLSTLKSNLFKLIKWWKIIVSREKRA